MVSDHGSRIRRIALAWCRDPVAREDLVQEILLQLWRSHGRFDPARPVANWVQRVATNVAISFVRRDQRRRPVLLPADLADLAVAPQPEPNEQVQSLLEKVQQLRPVDRALVVAWLEGLDHAAIGEVLGIGAAGVATRWWRLKERLQRELESDAETR